MCLGEFPICCLRVSSPWSEFFPGANELCRWEMMGYLRECAMRDRHLRYTDGMCSPGVSWAFSQLIHYSTLLSQPPLTAEGGGLIVLKF